MDSLERLKNSLISNIENLKAISKELGACPSVDVVPNHLMQKLNGTSEYIKNIADQLYQDKLSSIERDMSNL